MSGLNILAVDDDQDVLSILEHAIEADGHNATTCRNVSEARLKIRAHDFDMFLIDLTLPDGSGLDLAQSLRTQGKSGIVVISGRNDIFDKVLALEVGADDYITKPFHIRELQARIKSVSRRLSLAAKPASEVARPVRSASYVIDGIKVNPGPRTVYDPNGDEVDLTTLEFELLIVLTSTPNVVLKRDEIMDALRGPDWAAYDRTVDGLVSRLRAKLFPDGSGNRRIKTIRGVGYMYSTATR